jgi:hypothetical protein
MLDLSVLDSAALVEVPLGEHAAVAAAARRSNVDFFFEQFVPEDAYTVVAAPVYWDYQLVGSTDLGKNDRLRLMAYGSRDAIQLVFSEPNEADPTLRGEVGGWLAFHRLNAQLDSQLDDDVRHVASLSIGVQDLQGRVGPLVQDLDAFELYARSDLEIQASRSVELSLGFDFFGQLAHGRYRGPRPNGMEGVASEQESSVLSRPIEIERDDIPIVQPAAFAELLLRPDERG